MLEYLPHVQSASIGVWVRAGAVDELNGDGGNAGISHFIEHMLFKGTAKRSAREIAEEIDSIGGSMNAFTGREATCYYIKTLSAHLDVSIDVLGDMFTASLFDPEEMDKERGVIIEEMKMIEDVPDDIGQDLIAEAVFDGSLLGHRIIGYPETVGAFARDDITRYMADRYAANSIVISLAGNFDETAVMAWLETAFGGIAGYAAKRDIPSVGHYPTSLRRVKDIEQSHIFLGRRGVPLQADRYYAFTLFNSILGGGMSSRLFQNVREDKGLAYSVYSASQAFVDDGLFVIYAGVAADKEKVALAAIYEELERLAEKGVGNVELSKAKEQNKGSYVFGKESVSGRMFSTGRNELLLGRTYTDEEIIEGIESVTTADIAAIAEAYADSAAYSSVVICGEEG